MRRFILLLPVLCSPGFLLAQELSGTLTDIPGITVGHAQVRNGLSGVTVVRFGKEGARTSYETRGSFPSTRETDTLGPTSTVNSIHAIVLAGGSAYGADTMTGVMRCLEEDGIGVMTGKDVIVPIVPTAMIYDLAVGNPKIRPDAKAGYSACRKATAGPVRQGNVGAGAGATVGKMRGMEHAMKGGLGSLSLRLPDGVIVSALAVVNALGDVVDPDTQKILAGARSDVRGKFVNSEKLLTESWRETIFRPTNTVIGVVATNVELVRTELLKIAQMAHDGLARAVRPSHTIFDGDIIFAVSLPDPAVKAKPPVSAVGAAGAKVFAQAIVKGIKEARSIPGFPAKRDLKP